MTDDRDAKSRVHDKKIDFCIFSFGFLLSLKKMESSFIVQSMNLVLSPEML